MTTYLIGLHGLGGDSSAWNALAAALARGQAGLKGPDQTREVVVTGIDLPGFGDQAELGPHDVAGMRDHVVTQIVRFGLDRFYLAGQSMGAKIVTAVARLAEDGEASLSGLAGIILLSGSPPSPEPIDQQTRQEMLDWFKGDDDEARSQAERFVDDNSARRLPDVEREPAIAALLRSNVPAWRHWLSKGIEEDWSERIGTLHFPALVVAGSEDEVLGAQAQAEKMLPHLARARLVVLRGAAHLLHIEQGVALARVIDDWLAEIDEPAIDMPAARDDYAALLGSARVSAKARVAIEERGVPAPITAEAEAMLPALEAIAEWCLPGAIAPEALRSAIAANDSAGDGWRFAILPPDPLAWRDGLASLDNVAGGCLAALDDGQRDALLDSLADESPGESPLAALLVEIQAALARAHMGRPQTFAAIGFSGAAAGGDGVRVPGFAKLGIGEVEPWEPLVGSTWR